MKTTPWADMEDEDMEDMFRLWSPTYDDSENVSRKVENTDSCGEEESTNLPGGEGAGDSDSLPDLKETRKVFGEEHKTNLPVDDSMSSPGGTTTLPGAEENLTCAGSKTRRKPGGIRTRQNLTSINDSDKTCVMWKNVPSSSDYSKLVKLLEDEGFGDRFDCLYLPRDCKSHRIFRYVMINCVTNKDAVEFHTKFDGFSKWGFDEEVVAETAWGKIHGKEAWIQRYQDSPIMARTVPENFKPLMFKDGVHVAFPPSTKKIIAPRSLRKLKT